MVMAPPGIHDSTVLPCLHGCLAFLHRHFPPHLLPHIPSICLSAVNSSPHLRTAPQSLNSGSQPLRLPGDLHLYPGMFHDTKDCLILIPLRLPQISCFISLKCFYSDSDNCPFLGSDLFQFPRPLRTGPVLLTLLFFPLVPSPY